MGCSGKAQSSIKNLWGVVPDSRQPTIQQEHECSEGYLARAGNPSGEQTGLSPQDDDPSAKAKIANISLVAKGDLSIDQQMKSTKPAPGQTWAFLGEGNAPMTADNVYFQADGHIKGAFAKEGKYKVTAVLYDEGVEIDSKDFTIIVSKSQPGMDIKFIHPLPGSVMTSPCGERVHPVTGVRKAHKGCDFAYGDRHLGNVLASADGEVIFAGVQTGYGNLIIIGHSNASGKRMCITKYAHLSKICVTVGQRVCAGDTIGVEGNTGIGTGAHLHFEIRSGCGQGDQVFDPIAYINGKVMTTSQIDKDADGNPDPGSIPPGAPTSTVDNTGVSLSPAKVDDPCSGYQTDINPTPEPAAKPEDLAKTVPNSPGGCKPSPYTPPTAQEVITRIKSVLDGDSSLDSEDKDFILFVAKIESRYDPYAKNPTSSAMGLYQFLDGLANKYFPMIGEQPTCENRCNVEKATKAMVAFYKNEIRKYYDGWVSSGKTQIANKTIVSTSHSARYSSLSKGCWCYGLIHHDGVGNAVAGVDKQGCEYYQRKKNSA